MLALVRAGHVAQARELCAALGGPLDLSGADLRGVKFTGDDLRGADLRGANLWSVDFSGADLRGADFTGSEGFGCYLGADLTDAIGEAP